MMLCFPGVCGFCDLREEVIVLVPTDVSLSRVVAATHKLADQGGAFTLLGVCPMSEELIRAPIELAMEHDFPLLFVASRNQVTEDPGGGYVMGLDQGKFLRMIAEMEEEAKGTYLGDRAYLRFVSVDHCGPWYKQREKQLGEEEAMGSVKRTLSACIEAGYAGIHIDCSFAPPPSVEMNEAKMAALTADLFEFTEAERKRLGKPPVSYEIGTEETAGASVGAEHFRQSITNILEELQRRNLPKPAFVVGRTGALIEMLENTGGFDYKAASVLPAIAREFGIGFKEHNADYLSAPILDLHPAYGITGANVGPSFAAAQTRAYLKLAALEERAVDKDASDLFNVMSEAALREAPFSKWLRKADKWTADELRNNPAQLAAVTLVTGHYTYYCDDVKAAIEKMFDNLQRAGAVDDCRSCVMGSVKLAIMRYVDAFNLRGSASKIAGAL